MSWDVKEVGDFADSARVQVEPVKSKVLLSFVNTISRYQILKKSGEKDKEDKEPKISLETDKLKVIQTQQTNGQTDMQTKR